MEFYDAPHDPVHSECLPIETSFHIASILDISTEVVPLYSPSAPPSSESSFNFSSPLLQKLVHLSMLLIIFQVTHTAIRKINDMAE